MTIENFKRHVLYSQKSMSEPQQSLPVVGLGALYRQDEQALFSVAKIVDKGHQLALRMKIVEVRIGLGLCNDAEALYFFVGVNIRAVAADHWWHCISRVLLQIGNDGYLGITVLNCSCDLEDQVSVCFTL